MITQFSEPVPCDSVTLHAWLDYDLADSDRRQGIFGPQLWQQPTDNSERLSFPIPVGVDRVHAVLWLGDKPMIWTGPTEPDDYNGLRTYNLDLPSTCTFT